MARDLVRTALFDWHEEGRADIAELLTSELVANVVMHAHSDMTIRACLTRDAVRVEVDDESSTLPEVQHPGVDGEHGRGMLLIATLADHWGTQRHEDDGKTVWFELDLGG